VPGREIFKRLGDAVDDFERLCHDAFREAHDALEVARLDGALHQMLVALTQIAREVLGAVAARFDVGQFDLVEDGAHLLGRERRVIENTDEVVERLFEVDIVFP
jgi:hypothetical protein